MYSICSVGVTQAHFPEVFSLTFLTPLLLNCVRMLNSLKTFSPHICFLAMNIIINTGRGCSLKKHVYNTVNLETGIFHTQF